MLQKREPEIFLHSWKTGLSEVTGEKTKDNVSLHVMHSVSQGVQHRQPCAAFSLI